MIRRILLLSVVVALFAALFGGTALAQTSDDLELRLEEVNLDGHPEVNLVVSVPHEFVGAALTDDGFRVLEGGQARSATVTPVPTEGLQVALVLDTSTSMTGEPMVAAKEAAQTFLEAMPSGVEIAAVSFASDAIVRSSFTTDVDSVSAAVEALRVGGETALYDGLTTAAELFALSDSDRRIVVLLSDGGDTVSTATLEEAISSVSDTGVSFYAVELQSPEFDGAALATLADETDGVVVPAEDPTALTAAFEDIAGQIVNRYELSFTSEAFGRTALLVEAEVDGVVATVSQAVRFPDPPPSPTTPVSTTLAPVADVAATPSIREGTVIAVAWWERSGLLIGATTVFFGLAALLGFAGIGRRRQTDVRLVASNVRQRFGQSKKTALSTLAEQATMLAEKSVTRGDSRGLNRLLEHAGVQMRPGEFVVVAVAGALGGAAAGLLFAGPLGAAGGGLLTLFLPFAWLSMKRTRRQKAFGDQLTDLLQLMSGSIRTGFGLMQAVDTVAAEMGAPAGDEFQRVKIETQLGRDTNDALRAMAQRVDSEDFEWVVEAIEIHREVGGDLANILDTVAETVRDRISIKRRIETLSAEGKLTGIVLSALPFLLASAVSTANPGYIAELTGTTPGRFLIAGGLGLMLVGMFWMRRIIALKY